MKTNDNIDSENRSSQGHSPSVVPSWLTDFPVCCARATEALPAQPAAKWRTATLERQAPALVEKAREAGAAIEYLGIGPLFAEPRLYRGDTTDWILAPANDESPVVPRSERKALTCLRDAGVEFPLIYVAHEIPSDPNYRRSVSATGLPVSINDVQAAALIGPVPPPRDAVELSERLARRSSQVLAAARRGVATAGAIAVSPLALMGSIVAAGLDPIVLGAIPATSKVQGQPAAWYVLAKWTW
jgi:hypothetical protein